MKNPKKTQNRLVFDLTLLSRKEKVRPGGLGYTMLGKLFYLLLTFCLLIWAWRYL